MALVFVSYSRTDTEFVQELVADLRQHDIPIWLDLDNISTGENWDVAIERALEKATHMLLVMSAAAVDSKNVRDEIAVALDENKTIIPIMIETCKPPLRVRRIQYTDFREDYETSLEKLLREFAKAPDVTPTKPDKSESPAPRLSPQERNKRFWTGLLERSKGQTTLFANRQPSQQASMRQATGIAGLTWRYALHRQNVSVQLYIGTKHKEDNKYTFDELHANKQGIEAAFGEPLEWERLNDNKASRIKKTLWVGSASSPPEDWPAMQDAMIDAMIRLEKAISQHTAGLFEDE